MAKEVSGELSTEVSLKQMRAEVINALTPELRTRFQDLVKQFNTANIGDLEVTYALSKLLADVVSDKNVSKDLKIAKSICACFDIGDRMTEYYLRIGRTIDQSEFEAFKAKCEKADYPLTRKHLWAICALSGKADRKKMITMAINNGMSAREVEQYISAANTTDAQSTEVTAGAQPSVTDSPVVSAVVLISRATSIVEKAELILDELSGLTVNTELSKKAEERRRLLCQHLRRLQDLAAKVQSVLEGSDEDGEKSVSEAADDISDDLDLLLIDAPAAEAPATPAPSKRPSSAMAMLENSKNKATKRATRRSEPVA